MKWSSCSYSITGSKVDSWPSHPHVHLSKNVAMQLKAHNCTQLCFKDFSSLQFKDPNMIQHGSTKQAQWRHGVEELKCSALRHYLNPIEHLWDEPVYKLSPDASLLTNTYLPNPPDALVLNGQIPTAMLQNLLKSLSKRLESVAASFSLQIITKPIPCLVIRLTDNHYWPDTFYLCGFLQTFAGFCRNHNDMRKLKMFVTPIG